MNEDFYKAVNIAVRYFVLSGLGDPAIVQSICRHIRDQLQEGETRPLMLANRAIDRMIHQLEAEWELGTEQLHVIFFNQASRNAKTAVAYASWKKCPAELSRVETARGQQS